MCTKVCLCVLYLILNILCFYRPQRSLGNVMFLHVFVILFTGGRGVSGSVHAGIHPPRSRQPPGADTRPPVQRMLGDTGNKRAVRILLQCILVKIQTCALSFQLFVFQFCRKMGVRIDAWIKRSNAGWMGNVSLQILPRGICHIFSVFLARTRTC